MVPEKPPRRSQPDKEPVTLDLTAEEAAVVAEPVRAVDADEVPPSPASGETLTARAAEEADAVDATAAAENPETPPFDDDSPGTRPTREAEEPAFAQPGEAPSASNTTERRSGPSTSTLVASGIFGGIVALLLAGSMQYAGYLPAATPARTAAAPDPSPELAALRQEIDALKNRPAPSTEDLETRLSALESRPQASEPPQASIPEELTQRLASLERGLSEVKSATEATAASDVDLARRLQRAEQEINDRGPEQQAARAVAAAGLKAAIDRGGSFEAELRTFEGVAGDDPAVADLKPFAAKGVPARADLVRQAPTVADSMMSAVSQPDPDQGIGSRLLSSAMSVVKVRRVGDVEGDTPDAVVARFEDRLRAGDLTAAAQEWQALPEPAKAVSQNFKQQLDARIQVENLVGGTLARAIAGTEG